MNEHRRNSVDLWKRTNINDSLRIYTLQQNDSSPAIGNVEIKKLQNLN